MIDDLDGNCGEGIVMLSVANTYTGKFLSYKSVKAVGDQEWTVKGVSRAEIQGKQKVQLSFRESDRKLTLNKTSASNLAAAYGDDAERWVGRRVTIRASQVPFGNGTCNAVLCEAAEGAQDTRGHDAAEAAQAGPPDHPAQEEGVDGAVVDARFQEKGKVWLLELDSGEVLYTRDEGLVRTAKAAKETGSVMRFVFRRQANRGGRAFMVLDRIEDTMPEGDEIPF